jgi:hypothetical protein
VDMIMDMPLALAAAAEPARPSASESRTVTVADSLRSTRVDGASCLLVVVSY